MQAAEILDIADHAVNAIMRRSRIWWAEDRDDARQEAALAILLALRRPQAGEMDPDRRRGYLFGAARKGVAWWIRRWLRPDTFQLLDTAEEFVAADTAMSQAMLRNLESLASLLRGQRVKQRRTTEDEIALEVAYIRLMLEGYTIKEAAIRLGRSARNTAALRERVVPRLQMIANGKKPELKPVDVRPESLEALRRCSRDPEILGRRNQSISRAKRERDQGLGAEGPDSSRLAVH